MGELGISDFPVEHYLTHVSGKQRARGFTDYLSWRAETFDEDRLREIIANEEQVHRYTQSKQQAVTRVLEDPNIEIPVFEDTLAFIQACREKGIKTVIASSSENTPALLRATGLTELFDALAYGKTAEINGKKLQLASKPAPDVFLASIEMVGIKPEQAVGVEDAAKGIEAINAGGMMSIALERVPDEELENAGATLLLPNFYGYTLNDLGRDFGRWSLRKEIY